MWYYTDGAVSWLLYSILSPIMRLFLKKIFAQILPAHCTWKVPEKFFFMPKIVVKLRCTLYTFAHFT